MEMNKSLTTRYNYILNDYQCLLTDLGGEALFYECIFSFFPEKLEYFHAINAEIKRAIGSHQTVWGLQLNLDTKTVGVEYYFYRRNAEWSSHLRPEKYWHVLRELFANTLNCSVQGHLDIDFVPGMISIDIPLERASLVEEIDIYKTELSGGYCIRYGNSGSYPKNTYEFIIKSLYPDEEAVRGAVESTRHTLGFPEEVFYLDEKNWTFSLCMSRKKNGCDCVYYSGVNIENVLQVVGCVQEADCELVRKLVKPLALNRLRMQSNLYDIGYDFKREVDGIRAKKLCLYASF